MKKIILTFTVVSSLSLGAFAQGSINFDAALSNQPGITTQGLSATSTSAASTYFTGNMKLGIWYAATVTQAQLDAINATDNNTGGYNTALALLNADGFVLASTTTPTSGTAGTVTGAINVGTPSFNPSTVGLTGVPTSGSGFLALVGQAVGGVNNGWAGIIAFAQQSMGGSPLTTPPGTPAALTGWNALNENLVLSPTAVPEPGTMALAAIGGASLLLFRRRK